MMLVTTGLNLAGHSLAAVEDELPTFWERVDLLAKKKVDRIALSGVPVASMLGRTKMQELLRGAGPIRATVRHRSRSAHRDVAALWRDPDCAGYPLA